MFFHKHTHNPDKAIRQIISIVNEMQRAIIELQEDVAYITELLDDND